MKIKNIFNEETEEDETETNFKTIKFQNKEFRIYEWTKEIGDFNIPEGFRLAEHFEFIELFDNELINYPKEGYLYYFTKHYSKRKIEEGLLSGCYLNRNSVLDSGDSDLAYSSGDGRVVLVKEKIKSNDKSSGGSE